LARKPEDRKTEAPWEDLLRVSRSWRLEWNTDELFERMAREAVELAGLDAGAVFLLQEGRLKMGAAWPREAVRTPGKPPAHWASTAEKVARDGRALCAHSLAEGGEAGGFVFCVPLSASQGILGALYLESHRNDRQLTAQDQRFIEMFGLQSAAALEHILLYQSAITDPLTGLFSHRYFQQQVDQEIRRARRTGQPAALLLLDLDRFKELNDTCGHQAGNALLIAVAGVLRKVLRGSDVVARFGGDEFEVLLPETDLKRARMVSEKIRWRIARQPAAEGGPRVTATLGVAGYPQNALDGQELFVRADEALYQAKAKGRNRTAQSNFAAQPPSEPAKRRRRKPSVRLLPPPEPSAGRADRTTAPPAPPPEVRLDAPAAEQIDGHPVIRRLGTGSSGEVLLVRQPELDREVALKRPHSAHLTAQQAEAFRREARITASLSHPGVIPVHSMGRDADGRRYYTMKPVQGLSLGQILEKRGGGDAEFLRRYSQQFLLETLGRVAETVAYAHSRNVAHLDLNPWNVVLGEFGEVLVIDWGSSSCSGPAPGGGRGARQKSARRKKSGAPQPVLVPGSPRYLAPEQVPGSGSGGAGPAVDVHCLGTMLYEIITGKSPYLRDTHQETMEALRRGQAVPPEQAVPEAGIDPVLSSLCLDALSHDPGKRPAALEFAGRLGRYVRSEKNWEIVRFGPEAHPLVADEWSSLKGKWELAEGEWRSHHSGESIIVWRLPVPGDFRFVVEGWTEQGTELSLIGHGPSPAANTALDLSARSAFRLYEGYCFQSGAEGNSCSKLARHGHDVQTESDLVLEAGRRYRIEMAYENGWLNCFLDGRRVFAHRELFPLSGAQVGFYTYGPGAHFRPIEVHRQNWGLQPTMRLADDLYSHGFHEAAIERYVQVADRNPHRLEGDEARLKIGVCLAAGEGGEAARNMFRSVRGTALEPFALAEEAMLDFRGRPDDDPPRALTLFEELVSRHSRSPARFSIHEALLRLRNDKRGFFFRPDVEEGLTCACRLAGLGLATCRPLQLSQIKGWVTASIYLLRLGRYAQALEQLLGLLDALSPRRRAAPGLDIDIGDMAVVVALAGARLDLLDRCAPVSPVWALGRNGIAATFNTNAVMHRAVQTGWPETAVQAFRDSGDLETSYLVALSLLLVHRRAGAALALTGEFPDRSLAAPGLAAPACFMLSSSGAKELHERGLHLLAQGCSGTAAPADKFDPARTAAICRARWALEIEGDPGKAAGELAAQARPPRSYFSTDGLLLQCLLSSLGLLPSTGRDELAEWSQLDLAGPDRDLARMFFGKREPHPNELWPHPAFRPELRLWLALWLEARGDRAGARAVALPARDARYGLTNSQPALERLLARLD
jgi:diguanylate cyclase (GGDEF)-like protein